MTIPKRTVIFLAGVLIGLVIVSHLRRGHDESRRERDKIADTRSIPGMLLDYAQRGQAIHNDKGVLAAETGPGAEGFARTRRVLTGGRARFDEAGNRLPDEYLLITEYYTAPGEPGPASPVARYDFAYADRVRFEARSPADRVAAFEALRPLGAHLRLDPGSTTRVTASWPKPALDSVDRAVALLKAVPGVTGVAPVALDWKTQLMK